jgi:Glycosyltransferase family 87
VSAVRSEAVLEAPAPATRERGALPAWATHPVSVGLLLLVLGCTQTWVALTGDGIGDILLYQRYGKHVAHGLLPYRDFFFDWPPGAVLPVAVPALPGSDYQDWFHAFAFSYAIGTVVLAYFVLKMLGFRERRLLVSVCAVAVFPCALGAIAINSFDYWPALLTVGALALLVRGRDRTGLALLGLGIVTKVYPVVLLPIALVWVARRRGRAEALRGLAICSAAVAAVALPFALLGFHGFWTTSLEQLRRGLQMESLGASLLMSLDHLGLVHVHVVIGKPYSLDVVGGGAHLVTALSSLAVLAALAAVWLAYAAGPDDARRLVTASAASVAAWVAFNHVLSPQFLVWLFPLVPLVAEEVGLLAIGLLLGACLTTMTWFPGRFWELVAVGSVSWFALVRNLLLVSLFAAMLAPLVRTARRPLLRLPRFRLG